MGLYPIFTWKCRTKAELQRWAWEFHSFSLDNSRLDYHFHCHPCFAAGFASGFWEGRAPVVTGSILGTGGTLHSQKKPAHPSCLVFLFLLMLSPTSQLLLFPKDLHRHRMGFSIFQLLGKSRQMVPHLLVALQMLLTGIPRLS